MYNNIMAVNGNISSNITITTLRHSGNRHRLGVQCESHIIIQLLQIILWL